MAEIGHNSGPALRLGWIAIDRGLIEHHIVGAGQPVPAADKNKGSYSRLESWLDLLTMASWAENKIDNRGVEMVLEPGQTLAGRVYLARRWNWSEKTVRAWLDKLEKLLMISLACEQIKGESKQVQSKGHSRGYTRNVISICNWSKYQNPYVAQDVAQGPVDGPPRGHLGATQGPKDNKETNKQYTNKKALSAREPKSGRSNYWAEAMQVEGAYDPNEGVTWDAETQCPQLHNGVRAGWLERLGGDELLLEAELKAIAAYVQPNSSRPLKVQVESQLASRWAEDRKRTKRYVERSADPPRTSRARKSTIAWLNEISGEGEK